MPVRGRNAGNRGQGSKWITRVKRLCIYARDDFKCLWCGGLLTPGVNATLDHLRPRCKDGHNHSRNLVSACMTCNRLRGNTPWMQWCRDPEARARVRRQVRRVVDVRR